jgi:hypothetical protein
MNYKYKTDQAVNELVKFKIDFSKIYNTYLFNNKWINEIDDDYYSEKIKNIKNLLHKQLKHGHKLAEYLQDLLDYIWTKVDYIEDYKYNSFEFFELFSDKISDIISHESIPVSNSDLYKEYKIDSSSETTNEPELFNFLRFHSSGMNDFQTEIDFEKGRLLFVLSVYSEVLKDLHGFIYSIHMDAEYIDFKSLDFENFIIPPKNIKENLCHINLNKKSVAHLFRILLEENFLVFDEINENNNRLEMKQFVENNFTYQNNKNKRTSIDTFNREYSEVVSLSSPEVKAHKDFIDEFILKLQNRKNSLRD